MFVTLALIRFLSVKSSAWSLQDSTLCHFPARSLNRPWNSTGLSQWFDEAWLPPTEQVRSRKQ
jgi:hypothetical protein